MRWLACLCVMGLVAGAVGCQSYGRAANPMPVSAAEYDRLYEATKEVLRGRGFDLAQQSYRFGLIATEARLSPTAAEPWRGDNATFHLAAKSTLRQLRREVIVRLEPDTNTPASAPPTPTTRPAATRPAEAALVPPQARRPYPVTSAPPDAFEDYQLRVIVKLEARQRPRRRLIGATGRNVFSSLSEVPQEWQRRGIEAGYWQPLGRDEAMENRLMHEIVRASFDVPSR